MKYFLTFTLLIILITSIALSGIKNWVGGSGAGGQRTQWNRAANWSPSGVPTASDSVVIPLTSFNPVNMNSAPGTCGALTLTGGGSIYLSGTLNIVSSSGHSGHLTIGNGSTYYGYDHTTNITGDLINGGTFTAGTGIVTSIGSSTQTISGAITFFNLTVNNSAGSSIGENITVNGTLTLTNGVLTTGGYKVILPAAGSVSKTNGSVNGEVQRAIPASSTSTFLFTNAYTSLIPDGNQGTVTVSIRSYPELTLKEFSLLEFLLPIKKHIVTKNRLLSKYHSFNL